jgi:hypothetical protein
MSPLLEQILQEIEQLSPDEQKQLSERLAERVKSSEVVNQPKRSWQELRGIAPNILGGRDAQEWVNELRNEWEERELKLRENQ